MKFLLKFLPILAGIALAFGLGLTAYTWSQADQVEILAVTQYGDPSAVADFTFTLRNKMDDQHHWDTHFTTGDANGDGKIDTQTDYQYFQQEQREISKIEAALDYNFPCDFRGSSSYGFDLEELDGWSVLNHQPAALLLDVCARCENGSSYEETVPLADYYDFFPISYEIRKPKENTNSYFNRLTNAEEAAKINQAFGYTITKEDLLTVSCTKNQNGDCTLLEYQYLGDLEPNILTAVCDQGAYLLPQGNADGSRWVDQQIFKLEYVPNEDNSIFFDVTSLEPVFDLPEEEWAVHLCLLKEEQQVLLLSRLDGELRLRVFDEGSMELLQTVEMGGTTFQDSSIQHKTQENGLVFWDYDHHFQFLTRENGQFQWAYDGTLAPGDGKADSPNQLNFCYKNGTLVLAYFTGYWQETDAQAVGYKDGQPVYWGQFNPVFARARSSDNAVQPRDDYFNVE